MEYETEEDASNAMDNMDGKSHNYIDKYACVCVCMFVRIYLNV